MYMREIVPKVPERIQMAVQPHPATATCLPFSFGDAGRETYPACLSACIPCVFVHVVQKENVLCTCEPFKTREKRVTGMANLYSILLAPNPSLWTGPGTNTIIVGHPTTGAMVIDPAVNDPEHLAMIVQESKTFGGLQRILITHGHNDHIGGASELRSQLNIPIFAYSRQGVPDADEELPDHATFPIGNDTLHALFTPGHRFDHLCFYLEQQRTLFAGDMVASSSTVVIPSPPEGDLLDYMDSLHKLQELNMMEIVPSHGLIITNPQEKLADYVEHRIERERQILRILNMHSEGATVDTIVQMVYATTDSRLHVLAAQSVRAHLHKLEREGRAHCEEEKTLEVAEGNEQLAFWKVIADHSEEIAQ
jgi:glyoxylase-like metal-dependent hydrolase (beta-lactamase superfamily II)